MQFDVVIAGGGFAGAHCARSLGKSLGKKDGPVRVALVAERNVLIFHPMLAEVAGSSLGALDVVNPLRQFCRNATILQASVQKVDWTGKELHVDGGRFTRNQAIGFKHLVLALGSVTNLTQIPGMSEYGWPMKNVADALRLRSAVINRLEEANLVQDPQVRARLLTIVVVGGGYTGAETAGQILGLVRQARKYYPGLAGTPERVILVHSQAELLPDITPELGRYAREVLIKSGVEVLLNTRVGSITARRVIFSDNSSIEAHTVITTIGTSPNPVVSELSKELNLECAHGRVATQPDMSIAGVEGLWAIGDCAAVPWDDKGKKKTAPPTAQFAVRQGKQLGKSLCAVLAGQRASVFQYRYLGQMATIGEHQAVAEVMGMHFKGFLAWWMWRTIYLAKLPGVVRKIRVMIDWTFDLIFPREISVLLPPPDEVLRPIHLEKGELLFEKGSQCRAIFYVQTGSLTLADGGKEPATVAAGGVVDLQEADPAGCWARTATAAENCDLIVFRGRAFRVMGQDLRIAARSAKPVQPTG